MALNAFITTQEVLFGTKYLHNPNLFGSGISSNENISNESTWKAYGGIRYKKSADSVYAYGKFIDIGNIYKTSTTRQSAFNMFLSQQDTKEQCLESQMAASFAVETGITDNEEFVFYGATYYYKIIPYIDGLTEGEMNVRLYKIMFQTISAYDSTGASASWDIEVILRMSLMGGANLMGDVLAYWGGGCEIVGTCDYVTPGNGNSIKIYSNIYQREWARETAASKANLGVFDFETKYSLLSDTTQESDVWVKKRLSYAPFADEPGGSLATGDCFRLYQANYWGGSRQCPL